MKKILHFLKRIDENQQLIAPGSTIGIAVSGGVDSTLLAYALTLYRQYSKKEFHLIAFHVDVGFGEDFAPTKEYLESIGVEVVIIKTAIKAILEKHLNQERICCSRCSNLKKGALIKALKERHINTLALGHHFDDALETFFLNLIHGGRMEMMLPKHYLDRNEVTLIRPLILCARSEIDRLAKKLNLPIVSSLCPRNGKTERAKMKKIIADLCSQYPQAYQNFRNALYQD